MNEKLVRLIKNLELFDTLTIETKGSGKSEFIYLYSSFRSVEVSIDKEQYFIEYWDNANKESEASSVREMCYASESELIKSIKEWFGITNK